jgi:hypothetical protein
MLVYKATTNILSVDISMQMNTKDNFAYNYFSILRSTVPPIEYLLKLNRFYFHEIKSL